jgi:putative Holliday junction resolvase
LGARWLSSGVARSFPTVAPPCPEGLRRHSPRSLPSAWRRCNAQVTMAARLTDLVGSGRQTMIIMGLDYGSSRIGAAVCDELEIAAHPLPTIACDGSELDQVAELVDRRRVEIIVVGLPLRMDGTEGTQARKARGFAKRLRRRLPAVEVVTVDERLTSAQAHRALSDMGVTMRVRRREVDRMAAQIILQRYMGRRAAERRPPGQ